MNRDPRRSLGRLIYILDRFADRYARIVLGPHGIGKEQLFYLGSLIYEGDGITQEQLATRLFVDKSSAARMVAALEKRGLLERHRVQGNARAYRVLVTPAGRHLWTSLLDDLWRWQEVLTVGFTAAEREQAISLLQRMAENAEQACRRGLGSTGEERSKG